MAASGSLPTGAPSAAANRGPLTAAESPPKKAAALHFGYADGLRALAVSYVFIYHMMITAPELGHHVRLADLVIAFDPVVMFFILSGFLLSGPFLKSYLRDGSEFPLISGYALARLLRAFPLYYVGIVTISLYLWFIHTPATWWDFISHAIFLSNFNPATAQTISGPLWTLGVDIQFYIALPIVAWFFYKYTRAVPKAKRIAILFYSLGLLCVACILYRYYILTVVRPATWEQEIVWLHQLPGSAYVLAAGIGVRAFLETTNAAVRQRLATWAWPILIASVCFRPIGWAFDVHWDQILGLKLGAVPVGLALASVQDLISSVACVMVILVFAASPSNPLARLLSSRAFAVASQISFGFYIYHLTVITAFVGPNPHPSWPFFLKSTALSLAILLPMCYLLYTFIENPFLKIKSTVKRSKGPHVTDWSDVQKAGATVVDALHFPGTSEQV